MRDMQYAAFSMQAHEKNWRRKKPNVCRFELTFRCDLHCNYCYTDCYNSPEYAGKELDAKLVKCVLDKIYSAGCLWLCLTGGDPLFRKDFLDIYAYAKRKGFIITIFSSAYSMTDEVIHYLRKEPPFAIEITLSSANKETYERISGVKGAFVRTMRGIKLIQDAGIPLKIKTLLTADNAGEFLGIKNFVEDMGLPFSPNLKLFSRLNGDTAPCRRRIPFSDLSSISDFFVSAPCNHHNLKRGEYLERDNRLFPCAIESGDGIYVDPYGNIYPCNLIRKPAFSLLNVSVEYALRKIVSSLQDRKFTGDSECRNCNVKEFCFKCPGKALLETGNMEAPVEYYCALAKERFTSSAKTEIYENCG